MLTFLNTLTNLMLLLAWVRLWTRPSREFYFNPFLSGTSRLCDSVLDPLRAALRLPEAPIALLVMLMLFALRTLIISHLGGTWICQLSPLFIFMAPENNGSWTPIFTFSALHAIAALLRFWGVYLIVRLITTNYRANRAFEAFSYFTRPFSLLPLPLQPLLLLIGHLALVTTLLHLNLPHSSAIGSSELTQHLISPIASSSTLAQIVKTLWLSVLSMSGSLATLTSALFILIIGNLITSILGIQNLMLICHEGAEMLMGRFARSVSPATTGLNFAPLFFFLGINLLHHTIVSMLHQLISSPLLR